MKGKIFAVICMIVLMTNLTASCKTQNSEIRKQTQEPQATNYVEESNTDSISDDYVEESNTDSISDDYVEESNSTEAEVKLEVFTYKDVVKYKYATESDLIRVAQILAKYDNYDYTKKEAIELAKKVIKHEECTSEVLEELCYSNPIEIRLMVAESEKCNEEILISLAKHCADYTEKESIKLAKKVIKHEECTSEVLGKLCYSDPIEISLMVAESEKCNEEILMYLTEHCADYTEKESIELAKKVIKHEECTSKVLGELCDIDFIEINLAVAESEKCSEEILIYLAGVCVYYKDYDYTKKEAIKLAKVLIKNKKCTSKVLEELGDSNFFRVVTIGH